MSGTVQLKCSIDSEEEREKISRIFSAIMNNNPLTVQELLKSGLSINVTDKDNRDNTLLHSAVAKGRKAIAEKLLDDKADINAVNNLGDTPLHIAVTKKEKEIVLLLLKNNASVNTTNHTNETPYDIAKQNNDYEIMRYLREHELSDTDKSVHMKLREFVKKFDLFFEFSLTEYRRRLETQDVNTGKLAGFCNKLLDTGQGGTEGIDTAFIKAPAVVAVNFLKIIISSIGNKHNRDELKKLINLISTFIEDPANVRRQLVVSAIEIFQNFERQFVQVTADKSWYRAMMKVAEDAVNRVVNYHRTNLEEEFSSLSIKKGLILGNSKTYTHSSTGCPHISSGHTLEVENCSHWNTADFFCKPGLVTLKVDGSVRNYYTKKDRSSYTSKYGYRRKFNWENITEWKEELYSDEKYEYSLKPSEHWNFEEELMEEINNQDPSLMERRFSENLKEELSQLKQNVEENINKLEDFVHTNIEELLTLAKTHHSQIMEILINAQHQIYEIGRDNLEEHKKTQAGLDGVSQRLEAVEKKIDVIASFSKENVHKRIVWFDVRATVPSFTGREEQLEKIKRLLENGIVIITGLGGVGKSELALKYAHSHCSSNNVIWINAETHETSKDSFRRLLKELGFRTKDQDGDEKSVCLMAKEVFHHLAEDDNLFIFDNAEEFSIISEFFPPRNLRYKILITSQNNQLFNEREHGKVWTMDLETMPQDVAKKFVKDVLNINNGQQDEDIEELVDILGCLPLALQHAVAYIEESEYTNSIGAYVRIYKQSEEEVKLLLSREGLNSHSKTIFLTFKTTIAKLKKELEGSLAETTLNTIAYFASDNIPAEVFLNLALDKIKERDTTLKKDRADGLLTRAVKLLAKHSIISLHQGQVSIHRLLQEVIRLGLKQRSGEGREEKEEGEEREEDVLVRALKFLTVYIEESPANTEMCLSHIMSIWDYTGKFENLNILAAEESIAKVLCDNGSYNKALEIYQRVLNKKKQILMPDHFEILNSQYDVASVFAKQGKYNDAMKAAKHVLDKRVQILGPEHHNTLNTQYLVANILHEQGEYSIAIKKYVKVLGKMKRILGPNDPKTLTTQNQIANVLFVLGNYSEALKYYEEVLSIRKQILKIDHPDILQTQHFIANVYKTQGKYSKALQTYKEVLDKKIQILGHNHPSTLSTQHMVATVLCNLGKYKEALTAYQELLEIWKKTVGAEHPRTLKTEHEIANLRLLQGNHSEALEAHKQLLDQMKRIINPEHPRILSIKQSIATVLFQQGKYSAALEAYKKVLDKRERSLGPDHPDYLNTQHDIANVLFNRGEYCEALNLYERVLDKKTKILGPDHPNTFKTQQMIGTVLYEQGKYVEALRVYEQLLNKRKKTLGPEHPGTLNAKHKIAIVRFAQGKYNEALAVYELILTKRIQTLSPDHPFILSTKHDIANAFLKQEKFTAALEIIGQILDKRQQISGLDHPKTLETQRMIGTVLYQKGKHSEAIEVYQQVLSKQEEILGRDHPEFLTTQHDLADSLLKEGKLPGALEIFEQVLDKRKKLLGLNHPKTLETQRMIGNVLFQKGKYSEAIEVYRQVSSKQEQFLGADHPEFLTTLHDIADSLLKQEKLPAALEIYEQVLDRRQQILGLNHPKTLETQRIIANEFLQERKVSGDGDGVPEDF